MKGVISSMQHNKLVNSALVLIVLTWVWLLIRGGWINMMQWDLFGHYIYLPLYFEQGDLHLFDLDYLEQVNDTYKNTPNFYQFVQHENGQFYTKYTSGWALLMLPFYLLGEIWAQLGGYAADGFSKPYQDMVNIGCFVYGLLGLYWTKKVLRTYFSDVVSALTLVLLCLGTNWMFMHYAGKGSSNNIAFALIAGLVWQTIRFHRSTTIVNGFLLGAFLGGIGLVRPPDLVFGLIPLCWNLNQYGNLRCKLVLLWQKNKYSLLSIGIAMFSLLFIQLYYWHLVTGSWLVNSYANNAGEGFDWFHPHLNEFLFSYRKGWMLYTPIGIVSTIGLFYWCKRVEIQNYWVFITFILFIYVASSWTTWWYADSYSQRAMVDTYVFVALGMAMCVEYTIKTKNALIAAFIVLCLALNLFQTYQMDKGILHSSRMTKGYYWSVFGQVTPVSLNQQKLLLPDLGLAFNQEIPKTALQQLVFDTTVFFPKGTVLDSTHVYSPPLDIKQGYAKTANYWMRFCYKYEGAASNLEGKLFSATAMYKGKSYWYKGLWLGDPQLKVDTVRKTVQFDYISPDFRTTQDKVRTALYSDHGKGLGLKSVGVKIFSF